VINFMPHRVMKGREIVAIYPGSFDPPTNGHVDIIVRAARLFPRLIVAVGENPRKRTLFSMRERVEMLEEICQELGLSNVEVRPFGGLLVEFARRVGASVIIKGLRAVSDFENEFQQALMNRNLEGVETLFMPTSVEWSFLSSSLVKEVASLGGDVRGLVPRAVAVRLEEKFGGKKGGGRP